MNAITSEMLKLAGCDARESWIVGPFNVEPETRLHNTSVFPDVFFGRHSYINGGYIRSNVSIGRYCSIGRNVSIAAGDHPVDGLTTHPVAWESAAKPVRPSDSARSPKASKTTIGHDVWIGDNAVIVAGVTVETGSVIGANAVVTKDVPPYSIYGGVPARLIRSRFPIIVADGLLQSEWWSLPKEALLSLDFNDVNACLATFPRLRQKFGIVGPEYTTLK